MRCTFDICFEKQRSGKHLTHYVKCNNDFLGLGHFIFCLLFCPFCVCVEYCLALARIMFGEFFFSSINMLEMKTFFVFVFVFSKSVRWWWGICDKASVEMTHIVSVQIFWLYTVKSNLENISELVVIILVLGLLNLTGWLGVCWRHGNYHTSSVACVAHWHTGPLISAVTWNKNLLWI